MCNLKFIQQNFNNLSDKTYYIRNHAQMSKAIDSYMGLSLVIAALTRFYFCYGVVLEHEAP